MSTPAPDAVKRLVDRFDQDREVFLSGDYKEEQLRLEFLNPFFTALGWDMDNKQGLSETFKQVIHEESIKVAGASKAPDYTFRIGGRRTFFVEAKKPAVKLASDSAPAFQLRRYAWTARLPVSILSDFEEFAVYDCRLRPFKTDKPTTARTMLLGYQDYATRWDELSGLFSPDAIQRGALERYVESTKTKKGTTAVDDAFLEEISRWREMLAKNIALRNPRLSTRQLNFAVQRTIDRLIFLRICEDRGIESYAYLQSLLNGERVYARLLKHFRDADDKYNSGLFHFSEEKGFAEPPDKLSLDLDIDDKPLKDIIGNLYYPDSPYEFSVMPADVLGQVYEQFLGKVIRLTAGHQAKVEEKPEVRKAGGVYYTPTYIVDYIVKNTVGKLLEDKTPKQAEDLRILDPACGSGSFLLGAYQYLLDWHLEHYVQHKPEKGVILSEAKNRRPSPSVTPSPSRGLAPSNASVPLYHDSKGNWRLTTAERKRILLNNIYGVDIDSQAVEVTKLSLLLKVLEGENQETLGSQLKLYHERALPDLGSNIKCGNSLIGPDFSQGEQQTMFADEEERLRVNVFDWNQGFPDIMKRGGFDALVGNPPYLKIEHIEEQDRVYYGRSFASFMKRYDAYGLFIELATRLLSPRGLFGMIVPSTMLNNLSYTRLRKMLVSSTSVTSIVNLGGKVFTGVNNDTLILLFENRARRASTEVFDVTDYGAGLGGARQVASIDLKKSSQAPNYEFELRVDAAVSPILRRMRAGNMRVGDLARCFQGFVTGGNEAYIVTRDEMRREKLEASVCMPAVFGDQIARYGQPRPEHHVIYLTREDNLDHLPHIRKRLDPFREVLAQKREVRLGRQPWYSLHWPRVKSNFERKGKILVQAIRNLSLPRRVVATLDNQGLYADHTLNVLYIERDEYRPEFLLGILNSTLVNYAFAKQHIDINIKGVYLSDISLPAVDLSKKADHAKHDKMVGLVESMLKLHRDLPKAKTPHEQESYQRQIAATNKSIDALVYELHGLTAREIAIVEGLGDA